MNKLNELILYWGQQDSVVFNNGLTSDDLIKPNLQYLKSSPQDFFDYLTEINGFKSTSSEDENGFYFLEAADFKSVSLFGNDLLEYKNCYVFCDYLSGSWWYAICLDVSSQFFGTVFFVDGLQTPLKICAHTFSDFIKIYIADLPELYE